MKTIPVARASVAVLPIVKFLDRIGSPTERLLKQVHLPVRALNNSEAFIPLSQAFAFLELAARTEGIENLGIMVAQQTQVPQVGTFGAIVCQSLTLHDLLHKILKFHNTFVPGEQIWLTEEGNSLWFHHQYLVPRSTHTYQGQGYTVLMYLSALRLATGAHWQPDELHLSGSHRQKGFLELNFLGNTPIHFHQPTNAIRFSKALLSQPLLHLTKPSLTENQEKMLNLTAPAINFIDSLRQIILLLLPEGYPNIAVAAEVSGMSIRTFQRRLADNHLSYSQFVDQLRFNEAVRLLQDPTIKLIDIAFDLGFSDAASFTRAFKRWTGLSPREFRHSLKLGLVPER